MHIVPNKITNNILNIYRLVKGTSIQFVDVIPNKECNYYDCHNNCFNSGFEQIKGYYVVMDISIGCYNLVKHSVIRKNDKLVDITPTTVDKILFIEGTNLSHNVYSYIGDYMHPNYSEFKNLPETVKDYYIYGLIDPIKDEIFYIGKGKKNIGLNHINNHTQNKINEIHKLGYKVGVTFLERNIEDEDEAYILELSYIKKYELNKIKRTGNNVTKNKFTKK